MTAAGALLADLHAAGVAVTVAGDRLRYRPVDRVTADQLARMRAHRAALVALLTDREQEIAWREAAMRAHAAGRWPLPLLMAVPDHPPVAGRCVSCPAPVDADLERARCSWCVLAVARVLTDPPPAPPPESRS